MLSSYSFERCLRAFLFAIRYAMIRLITRRSVTPLLSPDADVSPAADYVADYAIFRCFFITLPIRQLIAFADTSCSGRRYCHFDTPFSTGSPLISRPLRFAAIDASHFLPPLIPRYAGAFAIYQMSFFAAVFIHIAATAVMMSLLFSGCHAYANRFAMIATPIRFAITPVAADAVAFAAADITLLMATPFDAELRGMLFASVTLPAAVSC